MFIYINKWEERKRNRNRERRKGRAKEREKERAILAKKRKTLYVNENQVEGDIKRGIKLVSGRGV